jgi:hypothetical protein
MANFTSRAYHGALKLLGIGGDAESPSSSNPATLSASNTGVPSAAGTPPLFDYITKYPVLHKMLGILPKDSTCFKSGRFASECFSNTDNRWWVEEGTKLKIEGKNADAIRNFLGLKPPQP